MDEPVIPGFVNDAQIVWRIADLLSEPFDDGVSNLLKYAFNMDLFGRETGQLSPGGI